MKKSPAVNTDKPVTPIDNNRKARNDKNRLKRAENKPAMEAQKPFNNPFAVAFHQSKKNGMNHSSKGTAFMRIKTMSSLSVGYASMIKI
jgi:hypothetical protein